MNRIQVWNGRKGRGKLAVCFTLVELLVVMAVIAILASILMPAMRQAVSMSRSAGCINNLRQNGMSILMYSDDYAGKFATVDSSNALSWKLPYIGWTSYGYTGGGYIKDKKLIYCSECPANRYGGDNYVYGGMRPNGATAAMTVSYSGGGYSGNFYFLPLSGFKSPSSTALLGDAVEWWGSFKGPYCRLYKDGVGFAHMKFSSGMVCADGRALQVSPGQLARQEIVAAHFAFSSTGAKVGFAAGYDSNTGVRMY